MNILNLEIPTNWLKINEHNQIVIIAPQELNIPPNEFFQINLKIILISLPKNHIIKISNAQTYYKIISDFWLPSCSILKLIIVSQNPLTIKMGETLCHLHILSIQDLLPGIPLTVFFCPVIPNCFV